ncbi:MAG TPA: phospholipase D-like domain-containing protein [Longimicrobiales bacterium]|nr:phospholipase D-like domain-containing protein [Longimicrobiales bacterium]
MPDRDGVRVIDLARPAAKLSASGGTDASGAGGRWSWSEIERAAGAPTICGNELRLQFEGSSTFSAWLDGIRAAQKFVYFENYLLRDDPVGRDFRDALIDKARQGVPVYLVHDWLGCWATPRSYWRPMVKAGVQVRVFNKPALKLGDPFGVLQRDHRKLVVLDGEVAHVGGMCVGEEWAGTRTEAPWRDTGVEITGPAARAAALAFERLWSQFGDPLNLAGSVPSPPDGGGTPVWLIEGEPGRARVYRTLHLAASRATDAIWITDAYFVAPRPLSEALAAAAQQGVDVRILVPAHNNWPIVGTLSRGGYRFLLESGVRIFEWQGPMMHAKTSVVDGAWCRVGSSNLNSASLMGNWELDIGILDVEFGRQLEGLFLADLASSSEIVLPGRRSVARRPRSGEAPSIEEPLDPKGTLSQRVEQQLARPRGQVHGHLSTLASVVRAGEALGGALAGDRTLGREDRTVLGAASLAILVLAVFAALLPAVIGWMVAVSAGWLALTTGARAFLQARRARAEERRAAALEDDAREVGGPRE